MVGIDGSPTSEAALAFAFEAADLRGMPLLAVHTGTDYQIGSTMTAVLDGDAIDADEHRLLAERLVGWSQKSPTSRFSGSSPATVPPARSSGSLNMHSWW